MTTIETLIAEHKKTITGKWIEATIKTYAPETAALFLKASDRFANPVVGLLSQSLEAVIDGLASRVPEEKLAESLDAAIRTRAVQGFPPSQAVDFIFRLKQIIRDIAGKSDNSAELYRQLDRKIDELALLGFDRYMVCREKIFEIRAFEVRNRTFRAFERAGLVADPAENG